MIKRYQSQFCDRFGTAWQVVITKEVAGSGAQQLVSNFRFGPDPLVFRYAECTKYDPIMSTSCTVTLESPGDRTFADLYATGLGEVCMHVYRADELYWVGVLDPELYSEPYAYDSRYLVELTFSDFGQWKRMPFKVARRQYFSIKQYIDIAASRVGLRMHPLGNTNASYLTVMNGADVYPASGGLTLGVAGMPSVITDNFLTGVDPTDDDSYPTWWDVIGWLLQPLGYRLSQAQGTLRLDHLLKLREYAPQKIEWAGDDATMDTDKIYRSLTLKIAGSEPVAIDGTIDPKACELGGVTDSVRVALDQEVAGYVPSSVDGYYPSIKGFMMRWGYELTPTPVMAMYSARDTFGRYFIQTKEYSGDDCAGVVCLAGRNASPSDPTHTLRIPHMGGLGGYTTAMTDDEARNRLEALGDPTNTKAPLNYWRENSVVCNVALFYLPEMRINTQYGGTNGMLRISVDLLLDARYNPYESYGNANVPQFINVPCLLYFVGDDGKTYYISNYEYIRNGNTNGNVYKPEWREYNGTYPGFGHYWLCYYNKSDFSKNNSGGWMTNGLSQAPVRKGSLRKDRQRLGGGDYIPKPPQSGTLHFAVGAGIHMQTDNGYWVSLSHNNICWLAYRNAKIEYVDSTGQDYDDPDVELSAALEVNAEEPLSLELRCASPVYLSAASCAGYYRNGTAFSGVRLDTTEYAAHPLHELYMQFLASQYDHRHTVLSGEVYNTGLLPSQIYYDAAMPSGCRFLFVGGDFNARTGITEAKFIELSPLDYE